MSLSSFTSFNRKKANSSLGFTLVEILVVITIIGILATLGLANFRSSQIKSRDARRKADLKQIQNAMELIYNDYGRYPASTNEGLISACDFNKADPDATTHPCFWGDTVNDMSDGNTIYLKAIPQDPANFAYFYEASSTGNAYRLLAHLENTQDPSYNQTIASSGVDCGSFACNYGVASANHLPQEAF